MSVLTDRVLAVLDNAKGVTFTNARAIEIVQLFNNTDENTERTLDQEAELFLACIVNFVRNTARRHKLAQLEAANDAAEQDGADTAVGDL